MKKAAYQNWYGQHNLEALIENIFNWLLIECTCFHANKRHVSLYNIFC